ncbi:ectonucleoside triphosphate diphosphohydrolase 6 [Callorhinchus milii]|uniref:nucleoside diphosphate phosphatase n=1 Tax=Callorhinchus milii TaxID=7868 RepID=A0A4W3HJK8_CALMI|nr:ectonucleoside triphosphate diphosphohydrolase 6 [Callorhinchus milii]|eukprot:gi/632953642/ref/XP_007892535.1/ PREDICTED: ectonucleoside triphosphate diphosphohydrolase 6 [Callorhinchus milii]
MKVPRIAFVFVIFLCIFIYYMYPKKLSQATQTGHVNPIPSVFYQSARLVFYGIMFDAGSTGTRIHVFKFTQKPNESLKLTEEIFKALKPGLSAYSDEPHLCMKNIQDLLDVAKNSIPSDFWANTPVALKATAGLRLLPAEKAEGLLDKVKEAFKTSPFLVRDDSVRIMDGTDEGISAWITVNFIKDYLHMSKPSSIGILDLGGGSTQITFSPHSDMTLQTSPIDYITSIQLFNRTKTLYSHSYLGLGLLSARLAILGGVESKPLKNGQELVSACLAPEYKGEWEHAEIVYKIKGQKPEEPLYNSCRARIEKILYKKLHKPEEVNNLLFYAFSYYYNRAVDAGLIDEEKGGTIKLQDYETAAKQVCQRMESSSTEKPFLCMDLIYINVLLEELGFQKDAVIKLARKIDNVEASWALGASLHYVDSF